MNLVTGRVRRRRTRPLLALGLGASIAAVIFVMPATALAHAGVVRTSPADGERLATSPATFEVEFSEPIGIDPSGIRVVDATGVAVDLPPARAEGALAIQALPPLPDGWYQASWSVVSSDGHIVHGAIAFAVGDATGPPPLATASDSSAAAIVVLRAIADLGLIVTVGAMAAWVMLAAVSPRVRRLATWAALVGAAGAAGVVLLAVADAGQAALAGAAGQATLIRVGLLLGVAVAVGAGSWRVGLVLGSLALITMAVGGHPGGEVVTAGLLVLHLAAACVWLGAAPAVLLVLLDRRTADGDALRVVRRFSRAATITLFVVVGAGSLLALRLTDAQLAGLDPRYVMLLGAKVALVLLAAILGAFTRRRLATDSADRASLRRLFLVDSVLLVVVIACSAGLTIGPPRDEGVEDGIHVGHCSVETANGAAASLSLVPARVGDNTVFLDGAGKLQKVLVELRLPGEAGAIEVELAAEGAGWKGTGSIPVAGIWDVTIALQEDAFTVTRPTCQLRVEP